MSKDNNNNNSDFFLLINEFLKNDSKKPKSTFATRLLASEWSYEQYLRSVFIIATFATGVAQLKTIKPYQPGNEDRVVFVPYWCDHPGDSSPLDTPVAQGESKTHVAIDSELNSVKASNSSADHRHLADEHNVTATKSDRGSCQTWDKKPWEEENLTHSADHAFVQTALYNTNDKSSSFPPTETSTRVTEKRMRMCCGSESVHDTTIHLLGGTMAYGNDGEKAMEESSHPFPFSRYTVIEQQAGPLYLVTKALQFYSNLLPIWMIAEVFIHLNSRKQSSYVIRRMNCWINRKRIHQVVAIDQVQPKIRSMVYSLEKQKTTFWIGQRLKAVAKAITSIAPSKANLQRWNRSNANGIKPSQTPSYDQQGGVTSLSPSPLPSGLPSPRAVIGGGIVSTVKKALPSTCGWAKPAIQPAKKESYRQESTQNYLFVGPSGTGKSVLAQAIAGSAKVNLFCTTLSELQSSSLTSGSAHLRRLFQQAKVYSPSVIILEHLELIGQVRKETTTHLDIQLFTELLVALTPREKEEKPSAIEWVKSAPSKRTMETQSRASGGNGDEAQSLPSSQNQWGGQLQDTAPNGAIERSEDGRQAQEDGRSGDNAGTQNTWDTHRNHVTENHGFGGATTSTTPSNEDNGDNVRKRRQNKNKGGFSLLDLKPVGYSGISAEPNIVIGTTDNIDKLDPAFIRPGRFNQIIYFTYPNTKDRVRLLQSFTGKRSMAGEERYKCTQWYNDGSNGFNALFTIGALWNRSNAVATESDSSPKPPQLRTAFAQSSAFPPSSLRESRATHKEDDTMKEKLQGADNIDRHQDPLANTNAGADESQWYEAQERWQWLSSSVYQPAIDGDEKPSSSETIMERNMVKNAQSNADGNEDALMHYFAKRTQDFTHADLNLVVSESKRQSIKAFLLSHHQLHWLLIQKPVPQEGKVFPSFDRMVSFSPPSMSTIDRSGLMKNRMKRIVHQMAKHNIVAFCFIIMVVISMSQCISAIGRIIDRGQLLKAKNTANFGVETALPKAYPGKKQSLIEHTFFTLRQGIRRLRQYTR